MSAARVDADADAQVEVRAQAPANGADGAVVQDGDRSAHGPEAELARLNRRVAELEGELDAAQKRAREAEEAAREVVAQAAAATATAATQGDALEALERQAQAADAAAREAREQRGAARHHAEEADSRAARLAARAERRVREVTASRDAAQVRVAELETALDRATAGRRSAEVRLEAIERQRGGVVRSAIPRLGEVALRAPLPSWLPGERAVGTILVLLGAAIVALMATGAVRVDLIP
jgi:hypothetical protein